MTSPLARPPEGYALFLVSDRAQKRWLRVIAEQFPHLRRKLVRLRRGVNLSPEAWLRLLRQAKVFCYLTERAFDWPTLALEAIHLKVPTLFAEHHPALNELLPQSPLRAPHFLIEQPDAARLEKWTDEARAQLEAQGVFDPVAQGEQYRGIYRQLQTKD